MATRHRSSSSRRPRCGQCGSRRFRRDPDTGLVICQEGHVLQGYREEEVQEDGDFVNVSSQKRYVRKGDKAKKRKLQKDVYGSERGSFLAYECLQLILRLQLKALRQEWPHLPPEIEAIARDLWAMFVSMVPSLKPTPYSENLDYVTGQIRTAREESRARSESRSRSRSRARSQGTGVSGSQADEEEEAEEERRLEAEIRRINDDRPQDTDEDIDTEGASVDPPHLSRPWARAGNEPMLVLAAIIYLSLITARVPVLWGDLRCLFASSRVPFLSVVSLLPSAMTAKLPEKELRRLERDSVPPIFAFQLRTLRFAANLTDRFSQSIQFPELNAPSVLWRCVKDMGLSPTFYEVALGLLTYLGIPLAVVPPSSVSDPWSLLGSFDKDPEEAGQPALPPLPPRLNLYAQSPCATRCTIIIAAVVMAAKMRYGLDGMERVAELSPLAMVTDAPPLSRWLEALTASQANRRADPHFAYELAQAPSALSGDQIDSLLDFAEETFTETLQPNVRSVWQKEPVDGLFGDRLPTRTIPRCVRPYDYEGNDAPPPRKSLLAAQDEWREKLHKRLYPLDSTVSTAQTSTRKDPLRPGEAYGDPSGDDDGFVHPYYERILRHAAMCVALSGSDEEEEEGWREMGEVVRDMEQTLLRRLRKEVRLPHSQPVSIMIDRVKKKRGRPLKVPRDESAQSEPDEEADAGENGNENEKEPDEDVDDSEDGHEGEDDSMDD